MRTEKNDLRSLYSKGVIKRTLLKLLEHKPLNKISVAELCKECRINRGTFYNHFFDINDVYESVESDFFGEIQRHLDSQKILSLNAEFFSGLLRFFLDSPVMSRLSAMKLPNSDLIDRIHTMILNKIAKDLGQERVTADKEKLDGLFGYVIGGCSYLIFRWAKTPSEREIPAVARQCADYTAQLVSILKRTKKG